METSKKGFSVPFIGKLMKEADILNPNFQG